MKHFKLTMLIENDFDTVNRVLNKFCGKGFILNHLQIDPFPDGKKSELSFDLEGDEKLIEIISNKINNFVDVYDFVEVEKLELEAV